MARRRRYDPTGVAAAAGRPSPLAEALEGWIAKRGLRQRLDLAGVVEAWPEVVGPQIASVTRALAVTGDGTLLVRVASGAWATELGLMTPRILARVNGSKAGRVERVRWMVGPLDGP
jgi:predicted nucleic acid-binding Zn ribbon protein